MRSRAFSSSNLRSRARGQHAARSATARVWLCGIALACCALATTQGAALDDTQPARTRSTSPEPRPSTSSGLPWEGHLTQGVRLRTNGLLHPVTEYARQGNFYGTAELVSLLERTAQAIAARWPGSQLALGELSASRGGKLDGHHSHRNGRDADVAFFMHDARGQASRFWRFVTFGSDGLALGTRKPLYFDDAKNWTMVSTILRDPVARVQYMFVAKPISTRLLMEGRRQAASDEVLRAAAAVMVEPKEGHRHANHFHVRIYCARDDRPACQDSEPYWPWYDGAPPAGQHAELPIIRWRMPDAVAQPAKPSERASSASRSM